MAVKLGNGNWAVKEDKLLAYNDNSGLFFNKEFDFLRGTSATYVAKDGLIKTAGIQPNIVTNGDFATDSDWSKGAGWTISNSRATSDASANSYLNQQAYEIGKTYKLGFEVLEGTIELRSAQYSKGTGFYTTGTYSIEVIPTTISTHFYVYTGFGQSSITNITVQEIQTDTPRIDFTNDTKGHLLLEPSRTNHATYSNDISQFTTLTVGGTLTETANYAEAPNGENEATRLQMSASGSNYALKGVVTSAFNDDYYISIYLKSNTTENQQVTIYGRNSLTQSYTVTPQWQRFEVSCNNASGSAFFYFGSRPSYSSDENLDILAWAAQLESGDFSTTYIPTTGATSTRNADVCNNSGSAQDFNSEEGVLYAEIAYLSDTGTYRTISINDGTNNNMIAFESRPTSNQIKAFVNVSGVNVMSSTQSLTNVKEFNKIAIKWKQDDFAWWVNGVQIHEDLSGSTFASGVLNKLNFNNGIENFPFEGKVRNVQVFTEALTDEQLQKLTS